jgi:hypothetical protein
MYFSVKKFAIWFLLLIAHIALCWSQFVEPRSNEPQSTEYLQSLGLDNATKGEVNARCKYFFCRG